MAGTIAISIVGDNRRLIAAVDGSESRLSRLGSTAGRVGRVVGLGLLAAGAGAVVAGVKLFQMGDDANDAADKISNIAGQMGLFGGNVDAVTGRILKYAEATARATGVDTNQIKATQAKLLTFKELAASADVAGGAFDRATNAAVDLAAAGFGSAESNATQLGKALNDPIKGMTALTKSGVTFTDAEKERITALVESNRLGKAQELVLGAIETQVGGTAEAMAGGMDRMRVTATQLGERVGGWLAPKVDQLADTLLDRGVPAVQGLIERVTPLARQIGSQLGPALATVGGFLLSAAKVAIQLDTALITTGANIGAQVLPLLQQAGGFLASTFGPVLSTVGQIITGTLVPGLQALGTFLATQIVPIVVQTAQRVGQNLAPVFVAIAGVLQQRVLPAVQQGSAKFQEWWPTIQKVIVVVAKLVGGALELSSAVLGKVLPVVIRLAGVLTGQLVGAIVSGITTFARGVGAVISFGKAIVGAVQDVAQFAVGVRQKIGNAIDAVKEIPGKIKDALSGAGQLLVGIGGDIIGGLKAGIDAAAGRVMDAVNAIINKIPKFIREKMGIASPSKVMKAIAKWIPAGIAEGIRSGAGGVNSAMDHISDLISGAFKKLHDKAIPPKLLDKWMARFTDEEKKLKGIAKRYGDLAGKLAAARDVAANVASAARGFANVTQVGVNEDGSQTAQSIVQGLRDRLNAIQSFTANVDQLRKDGLSKEAIDQIISDGVEKGSVTAAALVAGGPQAIAAVNALQGQIAGAATSLGNVAAVNLYGTGQQAADGFIAGLEADMEKLDKAASRIARQMVKAIKRELKIKSPSRVARQLSRSFTDGLVLQTYVDGSRVKRAGEFTAKALTDGFARPQLSAEARATQAGRAGARLDVHLTADVLTELEQGRKYRTALDTFAEFGGGS